MGNNGYASILLRSHLLSFFSLHTQDAKVQLTMLSQTPVSFFSSVDLQMLLRTSAFNLFFTMLSHTGGKLYLPPSLWRFGVSSLMYMASFTPLSNHLDSVTRISVLATKLYHLSGCKTHPCRSSTLHGVRKQGRRTD